MLKGAFFTAALCTLLTALTSPVQAAPEPAGDHAFTSCPAGRQWHAAILMSGPSPIYDEAFFYLVKSLSAEGLSTHSASAVPPSFILNEEHYQEFSKVSAADCLHFLADGLYSGQWNNRTMQDQGDALRLRAEKGGIDFILAFGTPAGLYSAEHNRPIPVLVCAARSPETTGLSPTGNYTVRPNLHVTKEPLRFITELNMFYDIFRFKRLGVVLDHDPLMQLTQGLGYIKDTAQKRGFELEICYGDVYNQSRERAIAENSRCLKDLASRADAVYLTAHHGTDTSNYLKQIKPLLDAGIPTLAPDSQSVAMGALISAATPSFESWGRFEAEVIEQLMSGQPTTGIAQYLYNPQVMYLNLRTARAIGWRPPFEILSAADVIYHNFDSQHQLRTSSFKREQVE